jgi:mRNA interferase RelE/StbE
MILTIEPSALKDLEGLDRPVRERIVAALDRLAETGHGDTKRLKGTDAEWRLRVGDWRVRFERDGKAEAIRILRVRHRREAYRE